MDYETRRLSIQANLDSCKTSLERNKLGQFSTPIGLAREILSHGLSLMPKNQDIRFLDPAIGIGSFFSALLQTIGDRTFVNAKGYEIDPHYGKPAQELWDEYKLNVELADFTRVTPLTTFNLLICNPPYVRHHHIGIDEKRRLQADVKAVTGIKISRLAGLYCYFLLLASRWMSEGGIAGWLIPSEFMDVNYGKELKYYLLNKVTLLRVHRFDPKELQFGDALVSSAVIWLKNEKPPIGQVVEFSYGGTHAEPVVSRYIAATDLAKETKWTRFPSQKVREVIDAPILSDLFDIKRGVATGGNNFFILSREKINKLQLPMEFFRPILPSPRHVNVNEIIADDRGNPILPQSMFLLNCRLTEQEVMQNHPNLWLYLETGKKEMASRYLCRSRTTWYWQEERYPSPFLCTYMGRKSSESSSPFRFLLNHSKAIVANSYLMIYPKPSLAHFLTDNPTQIRVIWNELNKIPTKCLTEEGRVYGGGLHKLEPKEMARLPASRIKELLDEFSGGRFKLPCQTQISLDLNL